MRHFALIGFPLGHSMSASYFTAKFRRERVAADYVPLAIERAEEVLAYREHLSGFNVTIPHKRNIMPLLDAIADEAQAVGAVNCVHVEPDGRMVGYNTDVEGIRKTLHGLELRGKRALVLGTGGASQAVQYVLREMGAEMTLVSRSAREGAMCYDELSEAMIRDSLLIVNTTPLGMFPNIDSAPDIPYHALSERNILFDCVYNPQYTRFLTLGRERGAHILDGLTMFEAQAEASWNIWNERGPQ